MVAGFVGFMHTHAHDLGLKAPGPHLLIGGLAGQADPGDEALGALGRGIGLAGGEEPVEILPGLRSGPGRPEFDKTGAAPGLGAGPTCTAANPTRPGSSQTSTVSPRPWASRAKISRCTSSPA